MFSIYKIKISAKVFWYAAAGDAFQIREGGHEMEPVASIRRQRGGKLCPDVPAQRGICLFIDASDLFFLCPAHQAVDRIICPVSYTHLDVYKRQPCR